MKTVLISLIVLTFLLTLSSCAGSPAKPTADPVAVLEALETAWNAKDIDAAMKLFANDAVETNGAGTFNGKDEIRGIYDKAMSIFSMDCRNFQVDGNSVSYECVQTIYVSGIVFGEKYVSVIIDGKIQSNLFQGKFNPNKQESQVASTPFLLLTPTPLGKNIPIIYDDDFSMGGFGATMYFLQHPNVEVKAITVAGTGETHCEPGIKNVIGLLKLMGETTVPVACGSEVPLAGEHTFPSTWRTSVDNFYGLSLPEGGSASELSAVDLISAIISESQQKIVIVATGPLTNIAEALQANPEIIDNIAMIYIMGGAVEVGGNISSSGVGIDNQVAEWNIYIDPLAANIVFNSGAPITLVPLDATKDAPVTVRFYETLESLRESTEASLYYDLLTANLAYIQSGGPQFWDELTAAIATDESLAAYEMFELHIVEEDGPQSGLTKLTPGGAKVRVATSSKGQRFEETFLSILNLP